MRSPTSSEDSRLVRIVVPCAQTRLPGPRGIILELERAALSLISYSWPAVRGVVFVCACVLY